MKIYRLGKRDHLRSITIFHAMARLGYTGLVITEPKDTYVSIGYFDRLEDIIDYEKCKRLNIPVIRREVGGGAVLLSEGQVFYQLILPKKLVPFKVEDAYRKFSKPIIQTYRKLGVEVSYRPINDLVLKNGKKISGQGAADIGECFVFVGNVLLRFDTKLMSELFKVQEEKFRDKLYKSLEENISWVERETGRSFSYEEVENTLAEEFSKIIEFDGEGKLNDEILELADRLREEMTSPNVLFEDTGRRHKFLKIREGVYVRNAVRKAQGGLLRCEVYLTDSHIEDVRIYGDFSLVPKSAITDLEDSLRGTALEKVKEKVKEFLERVDMPGVEVEDFLYLLLGE
ncbi:MAG: lipoate--protein ligase [Hydrogenobacter sp.]|uniref:lipoate--protein ligase n=1 Tax=Hydrogenobacter thermophilus TaxID=940 RepID=UPI0030F9E72D